MDDNVKSIIVENIEDIFGKLSSPTGEKNFLGTDIGFIVGKKGVLTTPYHIDKTLQYFGETLKGDVVNPST